MLPQAILDRISQLAPAHQRSVLEIMQSRPTLKSNFTNGIYNTERSAMLGIFEKCSRWTVPTVFPPDGQQGSQVNYGAQSLGSQLAMNLASKLAVGMFHPTRPFFRAEMTDAQLADNRMSKEQSRAKLAVVEKEAMLDYTRIGGHVVTNELALMLAVTGNGLLHTPANGAYRAFSYRDYDAIFDANEELVNLIVHEKVQVATLDPVLVNLCISKGKRDIDMVSMYTGVRRIAPDYYVVWQELEEYAVLADRYGTYSSETLEWHPQRFMVMPGRQAGVGPTELAAADFNTVEELSQAGLDVLAIMLDVRTLVNPVGYTKIRDFQQSRRGGAIPGRAEDMVSYVHDMQMQAAYINEREERVIRRLSQLFLMTTNQVRDAERVTKEELVMLQQELSNVYVGWYARGSKSWQRPVARNLLRRKSQAFAKLQIVIVTGLETLSRMSELENWRGFMTDMVALANLPDVVSAWFKIDELAKIYGAGWGVDYDKVVKSTEEKQASDQQIMQQQVAMQKAITGEQ